MLPHTIAAAGMGHSGYLTVTPAEALKNKISGVFPPSLDEPSMPLL